MGKKLANVSITLEQPLPLKKMWQNTCNKILLFPLKVPSSVAVSIFTSLYNHHYLISELLQHLKRKPHTIKALPFPLWINLLFWFFLWPLGTQGTVLWAWPQPAACFVWRAGDVWETSSREKGRGSKKNKEEASKNRSTGSFWQHVDDTTTVSPVSEMDMGRHCCQPLPLQEQGFGCHCCRCCQDTFSSIPRFLLTLIWCSGRG